MTQQLNEGLKEGDLVDLVLPMLSIDEFSSKIDDNKIIVVGFYCFEEDAAHDLSNFIERSPVNVEDTEVSPAPSQEGYYLCFVEMRRSEQFPERLIRLLSEVSRLTGIPTWQFTSIGLKSGQVLSVTHENLSKHVTLKPKSTSTKDKIREWFAHSSLSDVLVEQDQITLQRGAVSWQLKLNSFDDQVPQQAMSCDQTHASTAIRLERLLEGGYQVHALTQGMLIEHPDDQRLLWVNVRNT